MREHSGARLAMFCHECCEPAGSRQPPRHGIMQTAGHRDKRNSLLWVCLLAACPESQTSEGAYQRPFFSTLFSWLQPVGLDTVPSSTFHALSELACMFQVGLQHDSLRMSSCPSVSCAFPESSLSTFHPFCGGRRCCQLSSGD